MVAIDTHSVVKRLKDAGFTDVQAETVSDVVREVRELDIASLATKADLLMTKADLRNELLTTKADLRNELLTTKAELQTSIAQIKTEIAELKSDLLRYIVTISLGTGALVVALIKLIPGGH